ncbi:MAG: hypothetical protein K9G43_10465 [Rhodobacteraceae bacterium]|nr:hypothetical protein [Paracoccaceae bacterium]
MSVEFRILPSRNLVLAQFFGHILLADCLASAKSYAKHPLADFRQNQLIDLSAVTSYERDFVKIMAAMAQLPDHIPQRGGEPMIVYYAPSRVAQEMASLVLNALSGMPGLAFSAVANEDHAMEILGQPERSLDALIGPI